MPNLTYATQFRTAIVTDHVAKFHITMTITDKGRLPDFGVFVMSITDTHEPKEDTMIRVARVGDLMSYPKDRVEAVNQFGEVYRTATITKTYTTLQAAQMAADFLKEKVNALVEEYTSYIDKFQADTVPEILVFPVPNMGALQPLIKAYKDKVEERKAQELAVEEQASSCQQLSLDLLRVDGERSRLQATIATLTASQTTVTAALTALQYLGDFHGNVSVALTNTLESWPPVRGDAPANVQGAIDPYLGVPAGVLPTLRDVTLRQARDTTQRNIDILISSLQKIGTELSAQTTALATITTEYNQKLGSKKRCSEAGVAAAAVLEALRRVENALLDEIMALCPDFAG